MGSGTTTSDAANSLTVWRADADNTSWDGRGAMLMIWNEVKTLDHLISQQFRPHWSTGLVLWSHYGYQGAAGTVLDLSGNGNTGTPTGMVLADHAPMQPWTLSGPVTPYGVSAVSNALLADMAFCRGRSILFGGVGRLPIPDGTIT